MRRNRRRQSNRTAFVSVTNFLHSAMQTTPLVVLTVAVILSSQMSILPASLLSTIPTTSFLILILGMSLTAWFNRSRVFFILFILFLSQLGLTIFGLGHVTPGFTLYSAYSIISLLLPLNILFFASLTDRGILSVWGKRHFGIIALQIIFVAGLVTSGDNALALELNRHFISLPAWASSPMPDIAEIAFLATGTLLIIKRKGITASFKSAVLGMLAAIALAHHFQASPAVLPLFYGTGGLILIIAVIQEYYSLAYLDELTGLSSRRALNEETMRLSGNYVVAMLDIDHFKKFNDTYGHSTGDDVLRLVATLIKDVQGGGKPFRYGGEEFIILFPGKRLFESLPYVEELRERIAKRVFIPRGIGEKKGHAQKIHITVSIGVAEACDKYSKPEEVIKAADMALYRAKESGRNCVNK